MVAGESNETTERLFATMRAALLAEDTSTISAPLKTVRDLYESKGEDLVALAGWLGAEHAGATREQLGALTMPVLVANAEGRQGRRCDRGDDPGGAVRVDPGDEPPQRVDGRAVHARVLRFFREVDAG